MALPRLGGCNMDRSFPSGHGVNWVLCRPGFARVLLLLLLSSLLDRHTPNLPIDGTVAVPVFREQPP